MRLLLVEDDLALQSNLKHHLIAANYTVDTANDGEIGLFQGQEYNYDAAIIDVGLPKIDGIALITQLRTLAIEFPILILTARDNWQDKVEGLDAGADDYLTKPFHPQELIARLKALIRRCAGKASPVINNGPLSLNTSSLELTKNGELISLSGSEYKLFEYFMLHIGEVKSKTVLTEHIYDQDFDLDSNVIEVFIRRLRKKLDLDNQLGMIETLRGQGYRLVKLEPLTEPKKVIITMLSAKRLPKMIHSLKARLIVSALLLILILMPLIGFTLNDAFKQQVKSASMNELKAYVYAILAVTEVDSNGVSMPEVLFESQFNVIQSGLYAVITTPNTSILMDNDTGFIVDTEKPTPLNSANISSMDNQIVAWRSDSLLGIELPHSLPTPKKGHGEFSEIEINDQPHLIYSFSVSFELPPATNKDSPHLNGQFPITIHIIKEQTEFQQQVDQFTQQLWRWLMILMGLLLTIQVIWLWWTLKPLSSLETELSAIENGKANQLSDRYPTELQAVAKQLNTLLITEQNQRKRYRNALADLAHSLKTPLAVIQSQTDLSPESFEQVTYINRIIGHQLKRAQSAAGSAWHLGVPVVNISDKLVRNLPKIYCQPPITIKQNVDRDAIFKGDEADFSEILGNVLDNACKAATSTVQLSITQSAATLVLLVEDDGHGVNETLKAQIFERGIRADSYKMGHGIGLAIVRDLVDSYHGQLSIGQSQLLGGASFTIMFRY